MDVDALLTHILQDGAFQDAVVEQRVLPETPGAYAPFPQDMDPRLRAALEKRGIRSFYTHQGEVWGHVASGCHVAVLTPTASGKTLCYNAPILHCLLEDPSVRALYLFPTKALSQDQQAELQATAGEGFPLKAFVYDGDTPNSLRIAARNTGRIIISNPDMLHAGVLPNHPRWAAFFSHLRFVVIDEAHTYRGVFGSHTANVIRRLKRIAAFYGSHPQFILCSATIANPQELAETLIGEPVVLVDTNGAPRGEKRVILYNPPVLDPAQGIRRSVVSESRRWMLAFLRRGVKTILFAHSRIKTELIAAYVNEELAGGGASRRIRVEAYRSGLLPHERREIERGLREGAVQGVVSTNALELGIDIGDLDAAVVAGFPGSFHAFWQQSGRAGRRRAASIAVFVASAAPLDQFIMRNPGWFFQKSVEEGRLDPDNPYILADQVKCAAFELPFQDEALAPGAGYFGGGCGDVLDFLEAEGVVRHTQGRWYWADRSYPAEGVSLRSAAPDNVVILDRSSGRNAVIGEMDRRSAKELIFKNAVYIHRGRQYLVESLDIPNRKCLVREAEVNYFTDGLVKTDITVLSEDESYSYRVGAKGVLADVLVRSQAVKFKKIRFHTHENIGYGDIDLPEEEMQTRALALLFAPHTPAGAFFQNPDADPISVLAGLGTLLKHLAPVFLLCDSRDLGIAERLRDPHFALPGLVIYDQYPGGTGLAEALARRIDALFPAVYQSLAGCPCGAGCPSCVGPGGNKAGTFRFLQTLITGNKGSAD
ncbi:MAG: DEAD/DEAH box helicase [Treponema sp.]|jgi:DEAD/DEAH box helicase domain-containing protein|nr:DEAD/DEAH box helicase [Treponema sp.]